MFRSAVVACVGSAATLLSATPPSDDVAVREVTVEGLFRIDREMVLHHLGIERGRPLDPAKVNGGIQSLWATELIDGVVVDKVETEHGLLLQVHVVERPWVTAVEYSGFERVDRRALLDGLGGDGDGHRLVPAVGEPLRRPLLHRLARILRERLQERGFVEAEVKVWAREEVDATCRVLVRVSEGARWVVRAVEFDGNDSLSNRQLRRAMGARVGEVGRTFSGGSFYSPEEWDRRRDRIREHYRSQGFKDAIVGPLRVTSRVTPKAPKGDSVVRRAVRITVPVTEGARYRFGGITITGNAELGDLRLLKEIGRPAKVWLDLSFAEQARRRIESLYQSRGHLYTSVRIDLLERSAGVVDLRFVVEEQAPMRVGRIEFAGNSRTAEELLRRELAITEGDLFDTGALRAGLRKVHQLGFVELVEDDPTELEPRFEDEQVDLLIKVREGKRYERFLGGGYSGTYGLSLRLALEARNLRGRGQSLALQTRIGDDERLYRLRYAVPWLFDRPYDLVFDLLSDEVSFLFPEGETSRREVGGRVRFRRRLGLSDEAFVRFSRLGVEDLAPGSVSSSDTRSETALALGYRYDDHDSLLMPFRGRRLHFTAEQTGGLLGGDVSTLRADLGAVLTRTLTRGLGRGPVPVVGRLRLAGGWLAPFDSPAADALDAGSVFSPLDRYFLGGENSVRGFAPRSIWLRDPETGESMRDKEGRILGADSYLQLNVELHLAPRGPFRLVFFSDLAQPFGRGSSYSLDGLRASAGLELRMEIPRIGLPVRLIWSESLRDLRGVGDDREAFDRFTLGLGVNF